MSIPHEEWLDAAKRLAVGTKTRIRHNFEIRSNMVVFNNVDSWSCWCFECNDGGRVAKSHPVLVEEPTPSKGSTLPLPEDCVPLEEASESLQRAAYGYLLVRGIDPSITLAGMELLVSPSTMRLCIPQNGGAWVGRGMAGQMVKAMTYSDRVPPRYAIHPDDSDDFTGKHVVLLEDYLSALKVRYADPSVQAVSVQGCSIQTGLTSKLLKAARISIMLDGDVPGVRGSAKILRTLRGLIKNVQVVNTPTGKDPKNLSNSQIRSLLHGNNI